MALTEDQLRLWGVMETDRPEPSGGQTPQQAVTPGVASFLWACDFDPRGE